MCKVLAALLLIASLSSCGNGYMLYETRYIPEPGQRITNEEYGQLPWHEPAIDSNLTTHTPSRGPTPRFQTPSIMRVETDVRDFHHNGDANAYGHLNTTRAENSGVIVPASSAADAPIKRK